MWLAATLLLTTNCAGPMGRIGLDHEVIATLAQDQAAWCVTIEVMTLAVWLSTLRVTYWRENVLGRPMSNMRDCVVPPWP